MNSFFQDLSIQSKLKAVIMMTSALALFLASMALLANHALTLRLAMKDELDMLAQVLVTHSTAALAFDDSHAAAETLEALKANPNITFGRILRRDGTPLAEYIGASPDVRSPTADAPQNRRHRGGPHLEIAKEVTLAGAPIGSVHIRASLAKLNTSLTHYVGISTVIILLSLTMASLLASKLQKLISIPIEQLAAMMKIVSQEKDFSRRMETIGRDEVGTLIEGFNEMLAQIERRDEELERHRRDLERQVAERTRELQESMDEVHDLAFYDNLTGLANRVLLRDRIEQAVHAAERHKRHVAVLFLDLDRFKRINDTFGHHIGDLMLKKIAERLSLSVRQSDSVCYLRLEDTTTCVSRLGGDEFCILLTDLMHPEDAAIIAQRIIEAVSLPLNLEGFDIFASTSIGISIFPGDGNDGDALLKNADRAMYHAKEKGRNNYQFYAESMNAAALKRLMLESDLRRALERHEFSLFYQPQLDLEGRIIGAEALIRWHSPQRGTVSPGEFIPVCEESGLIVPLSTWVLRTACEQILEWQSAGLPPVRLSINLSGQIFNVQNSYRMICDVLEETGVDPGRLEVEITESTLMQHPEEVSTVLHQLKRKGISIAIDDFGTGYSSLSYLKTFPIDTLKIDRSFIADIASNPDDAAIIRAIVAMGRHLDLKVLAEGVETEEQLAFLRDLGCHAVQGFLFSPPVPAEVFAGMLQENTDSRRLQGSRGRLRSDAVTA